MKSIILVTVFLFSIAIRAESSNLSCATSKGDLITVNVSDADRTFPIKLNGKEIGTTTSDEYKSGKMLFSKDGYSVFEWDTYLEKNANGAWELNRYWYCNSYYFEERCATDEYRLEVSSKLNCSEN